MYSSCRSGVFWRDARLWRDACLRLDAGRFSPDLGRWIRRLLVVLGLIVVLQWMEPAAMSGGATSSSSIKASGRPGSLALQVMSPSSSAGRRGEGRSGGCVLEEVVCWRRCCVGPVLWRGTGHDRIGISGKLPRWKKKELQVSSFPFSENKRLHRPFPHSDVVEWISLLSAGRGGEGEEGTSAVAAWMRKVNLLLICAQHMVDMDVAMICGRQDCRPSRRFYGTLSTSNKEAPDGDLDRRFTPPSHQVVRPRLLVAGGRERQVEREDHL